MEHAVVVGATGRVGTAVVKFALEAGHRVTGHERSSALPRHHRHRPDADGLIHQMKTARLT